MRKFWSSHGTRANRNKHPLVRTCSDILANNRWSPGWEGRNYRSRSSSGALDIAELWILKVVIHPCHSFSQTFINIGGRQGEHAIVLLAIIGVVVASCSIDSSEDEISETVEPQISSTAPISLTDESTSSTGSLPETDAEFEATFDGRNMASISP